VARAARSVSISDTSRRWVLSCRSRSIRLRASSAAATTRARDAASAARLSAFAIATANSSVKLAKRTTLSAGSDCSRVEPAAITPHSRPSTMIGAPTPECTPASRTATSSAPSTAAILSTRAGRPVSNTSVPGSSSPSSIHRQPTGEWPTVQPQDATISAAGAALVATIRMLAGSL
jgi:hypothetical protein